MWEQNFPGPNGDMTTGETMISQKAIVIAEDNEGHATLIKRNLRRGKVRYPIIHLKDGEETLNFFTRSGEGPHMERGVEYVLLLDINMPKINGIEILRELRNNHEFINLPIIMVTTTNNPTEIEKCYSLG